MRTAEQIEENNAARGTDNTRKISSKARPGAGQRLKPWQWKKGQSGNPGGRPKNDIAKEIAQAIFSQNPEAIYHAIGGAIMKGNAYAFKEAANRAFGPVPTKIEHSGPDGAPIPTSIEVRFVSPDGNKG